MTCEICHEGEAGTVRVSWQVCHECATSIDDYASMTPAERRADDASQAAYVAETSGRDW